MHRVHGLLDHIDPNSITGTISMLTLEFLHLGKCFDPRDHLFGIQALLHPIYRTKVDYNLSVQEVFWLAMESMCKSPEAIAVGLRPNDHEKKHDFRLAPYWLMRDTMGLHKQIADDEISRRAEALVIKYHDIELDIMSNELERRAISALLQGNSSSIEDAVSNVAHGMINDGRVLPNEMSEANQERACEHIRAYFVAHPEKWPQGQAAPNH